MSSRKKDKAAKEIYVNGKRVVGAIKAAAILTEKAKRHGSDRVYSRDTIFRHYDNGSLTPAMETPAGNLYYVEDIEALPISPERGRPNKIHLSA